MKILFVCEYNACRSQMGEGLAKHLLQKDVLVQSAGPYPGEVNHLTIEVMREIGIDISAHRSKLLNAVQGSFFDTLIVLAEPAVEATQAIKAKTRLHWFYPDPLKTPGTPDEVKEAIRHVRDNLKERIGESFAER